MSDETVGQPRERATNAPAGRRFAWEVTSVSVLVLMLGTLVYLFDRPEGSVPLFAEVSLARRFPIDLGMLSQHFPSFAHTFSFAAMTAMLMGRKRDMMLVCLTWLGIETVFEVGQLPILAHQFAALFPQEYGSLPLLSHTIRYFANGTFDPGDLLCAGVGALSAYVFVLWSAHRTSYRDSVL